MATIIDALLITLGLDPSGVKQGSKEAEDTLNKTAKTAEDAQGRIDEATKKTDAERKKAAEEEKKRQKESEAAAKRLEDGYKKIRDSLMDIAAAMVAAVAGKEFVSYITQTDTAAMKLATNVGATSKEVLTLQSAFEGIGASGDEASGALLSVNKILEDLKNTGFSEALYPLQRAGLDVGKFRDAHSQLERLGMLSDALKKMTPQDAQYWGQKAGFSEETVNLLIRSNEELDKYLKRIAEQIRQTEADKRATSERNDAYAELHRTFASMGRTIVTQLTPIIVGMQKAFAAVFDYLADKPTLATGAIGGLVSVMGLLLGFKMTVWAQQIGGAFGVLGTVAGALVGRLSLVLATITAIYEVWQLGKSLWDWYQISHRDGIHLTPEAQARVDRGEAAGVTIGAAPAPGPELADKEQFLRQLEQQHGLPTGLLDSVWRQESGRGRNLTSSKGARGDFQFMPGTAAQYGVDVTSFDSSARGAAQMYEDLLHRYGGDLRMALAGYNWGSGNLDRQGLGRAPTETRNYVDSVIAGMNIPQGGGTGGTSVSVGPVTINTSAPTMEGAGSDFGRGLRGRLALASQSNGNVN